MWTGAGGDARWSNSTNWTGCPRPADGDDLVFPDNGAALAVNDLAGLTLNSIRITGLGGSGISYVVSGLGVTTPSVVSAAPADSDGHGPTLALPITIGGGASCRWG